LRKGRQISIRWAVADEEKLREISHAGKSIEAIAEQLSVPRSIGAVEGRIRELGLRRFWERKDYTKEEIDIIRDMAEKGASIKQIQERLGGTRTMMSIATKKQKLGLRMVNKLEEYTKEELDILRDMAEKGASNKEIQERLGGTRTTNAIASQNHALGLTKARKAEFIKEEVKIIRDMAETGLSNK